MEAGLTWTELAVEEGEGCNSLATMSHSRMTCDKKGEDGVMADGIKGEVEKAKGDCER